MYLKINKKRFRLLIIKKIFIKLIKHVFILLIFEINK